MEHQAFVLRTALERLGPINCIRPRLGKMGVASPALIRAFCLPLPEHLCIRAESISWTKCLRKKKHIVFSSLATTGVASHSSKLASPVKRFRTTANSYFDTRISLSNAWYPRDILYMIARLGKDGVRGSCKGLPKVNRAEVGRKIRVKGG